MRCRLEVESKLEAGVVIRFFWGERSVTPLKLIANSVRCMVIIRYRVRRSQNNALHSRTGVRISKKVIDRENRQFGRQITTHVTVKFFETSIEKITITVEFKNIAINAEYLLLRRVQPIFLSCLVLFLQIYLVLK